MMKIYITTPYIYDVTIYIDLTTQHELNFVMNKYNKSYYFDN
jgi:hypothetical protein